MRLLLALVTAATLVTPVAAAELSSQYTRLNHQQDCKTVRQSPPDEGDWADMVCPGFSGYSYTIRYTDGRESVTYGYHNDSGMPTFAPFNYSNGTVEWRVQSKGGKQVPVAAIQRFFLADIDGNYRTQILVVSKVGQPGVEQACVTGYVNGNGGAAANERARVLSDAAEAFRCGRDRPTVDAAIKDFVPPAE